MAEAQLEEFRGAFGSARRWAWLPLVLVFLSIAADALSQPGGRLPLSLLLLLPFGAVMALLVGFVASNIALVASVGLLIAYSVTHAAPSALDASTRANLLASLFTTQLFVQRFQATFRRATDILRGQGQVIIERVQQQERLTHTLVTDIRRVLEAMRAHSSAHAEADVCALSSDQQQLAAILKDAQKTLPRVAVGAAIPGVFDDFRAQMMRWILIITGCETVLLAARAWFTGIGAWLPSATLSVVCVALLVSFQRHPERRSLVALCFALCCSTTIVAAMTFWGLAQPPPGTIFLLTLAYHAVLIGRRFSGVGMAVLNLAILTVLAAGGAAHTSYGARFLGTAACCALVMQLGCHYLQSLVSQSLSRTTERARELSRLDVFRTRICGTLFHDVANLAQGMGMLLSTSKRLVAQDLLLFERLRVRLAQLIDAATQALEGEGVIAASRLAEVGIASLFQEVAELFGFRLAEKSQSLSYSCSEPLRVRAQTELLRDSVMANLMSNAIKFSPNGAVIELRAARTPSAIEISVRDHGPGWPAGLEQALSEGEKLPSTAGSAGESGLGLGLTLAREHVRRMGGQFTLRSPAGGGSEAVVELPEASLS